MTSRCALFQQKRPQRQRNRRFRHSEPVPQKRRGHALDPFEQFLLDPGRKREKCSLVRRFASISARSLVGCASSTDATEVDVHANLSEKAKHHFNLTTKASEARVPKWGLPSMASSQCCSSPWLFALLVHHLVLHWRVTFHLGEIQL